MARSPGAPQGDATAQRSQSDDRPQCKGIKRDGQRCTARAKPGEEFCGRHPEGGNEKLGRESKFDDEGIRNAILTWMRNGSYARAAAEANGVGETTLYRWLEDGKADVAAGVESEKAEFWEAFTRARAEGEIGLVADARKAARQDGRLALEMLARRHPKQWGRRRLELVGDGGGPVETAEQPPIDYDKLTLDQKRELLQLLELAKPDPAPIGGPAE